MTTKFEVGTYFRNKYRTRFEVPADQIEKVIYYNKDAYTTSVPGSPHYIFTLRSTGEWVATSQPSRGIRTVLRITETD